MTSRSGTTNAQWLFDQLVVALSHLARPAEGQIAYLATLGSAALVDELALELADVVTAALVSPELLSERQREPVRALDALLDDMSGAEHADLWSARALQESERWSEVRAQARVALAELHAQPLLAR